jgi:hypothetical protein
MLVSWEGKFIFQTSFLWWRQRQQWQMKRKLGGAATERDVLPICCCCYSKWKLALFLTASIANPIYLIDLHIAIQALNL